MKGSNKHKATVILVFFAIGYFISSAFKNNFIGGLISSMCGAALIGGLADWFGVTAIFKKPMGVNWPRKIFRTDILRNSKNKFIFTIRDMVQNDLLNKDKINEKIRNYDFYSLIWDVPELKDEVKFNSMLDTVKIEIEKNVNIKESITKINENYIDDDKYIAFIGKILKRSIGTTYYNKVLNYAANEAINVIESDLFSGFMEEVLEEVIAKYKEEKGGEGFGDKLLYSFALNPQLLSDSIHDRTIKYLDKIKFEESNERIELDEIIKGSANYIKDNEKIRNALISLKDNVISNSDLFLEQIDYEKVYISFRNYVTGQMVKLQENEEVKESVNKFIKKVLMDFVNSKHDEIGNLVEESLNKYDEDEIIKLAEDKAGDDLQIIRINGSLVGGMVGTVIFLVSYFI